MEKWIVIALVLFFSFNSQASLERDVVFGFLKKHSFVSENPNLEEKTSDELVKEFEDNEFFFYNKYKNKFIKISGKVYSIKFDLDEHAYMLIASNTFTDFVKIYPLNENKLLPLKKDENVLLTCKLKKKSFIYPTFEYCRFVYNDKELSNIINANLDSYNNGKPLNDIQYIYLVLSDVINKRKDLFKEGMSKKDIHNLLNKIDEDKNMRNELMNLMNKASDEINNKFGIKPYKDLEKIIID